LEGLKYEFIVAVVHHVKPTTLNLFIGHCWICCSIWGLGPRWVSGLHLDLDTGWTCTFCHPFSRDNSASFQVYHEDYMR
jgi:hypothetical protein